MTALVVTVVGLVVLLAGRPRPHRRLRAMFAPPVENAVATEAEERSPLRIGLAIAALIGSIAMIGGAAGLVAGAVLATAISAAPVRRSEPTVAPDQVPFAVDLIAGCLDVGASLSAALDAAADASTGLLRQRCRSVAAALRSGAASRDAWQPWAQDPSLAAFARTAARTSQSGAAAAEDFRRAASRLRSQRRAAAEHRVRQASVWLVVPLGLCFLPAFVLVAVVPIVIGLFPSLGR